MLTTTADTSPTSCGARWMAPALAVVAFLVALLTIDDYGLTIDEPINLGHGKTMVNTVCTRPSSLLTSEGILHVWRSGHEHPPLTRFLIGWGQWVFDPAPENPQHHVPRGGRCVSALAYAALVWLSARTAVAFGGLYSGIVAGLATAMMPRIFAHAHFASPEVISAFFVLWSATSASHAMAKLSSPSPFRGKLLSLVVAGLLLGLALLTKLSAVLTPVFVGLGVIGSLGFRSLPGLFVWGAIGVMVFLSGWPWMWPIDLPGHPAGWNGTIDRLRDFLATGSSRSPVFVWYLGQQYASNALPWHYVPVFFLATVPLVVHALAFSGVMFALKSGRGKVDQMVPMSGVLFSLAFFLQPMHRYDGERLFLFVFPFWGILAGLGAAGIMSLFSSKARILVGGALVIVLCLPIHEIALLHPFELSYFNRAVRGLSGADRLGLEATYWGETITPRLLDHLAQRSEVGDRVVVLPTLYSGHALRQGTHATVAKKLQFLPGEAVSAPGQRGRSHRNNEPVRWAIVFHRRGYTIDPMPTQALETGTICFEESFDGVWLARLLELPAGWRVRPSNE